MSIKDDNGGDNVDCGNTNSNKQFLKLLFLSGMNYNMCIKLFNPNSILIY